VKQCRKGEPGAHHWVIETPDGPNSFGECQNCHWVKLFENTIPEPSWGSEDQVAKAKVNAKAARQARAADERSLVFEEWE
jgi:hypothetical protein